MKVKLVCDNKNREEILDEIRNSELTITSDDPDIMIVDLKFQKDYIVGTDDNISYVILNAIDIELVEVIDNVTRQS